MPVITDRVYFVNSTLWASYLPGCGETYQIGHYWLTIINENNYSILSFFKKNAEAKFWIKQDF
jgi:hypothetical protein